MRTEWVFLLAFLIGCDSLWTASLIPNPERCDVSPDVCPSGQVCDSSTGRCSPAPVTNPGGQRCGMPWRTGTGSFSFQANPLLVSTGTDGDIVSIAVGDVDGNRTPDLAAVSASLKLWSYLGSGDGQFAARASTSFTGTAGMIRLADLNGDGRDDFLVSDTAAKQILVTGSAVDGGFGTTGSVSVPSLQGAFALADMDRSGATDILAGLDGSDGLMILPGNGSGSFGAGKTIVNSRKLTHLCTADFNQDGLADVAATESADSSLLVYLNNNSSSALQRRSTSLPVGHYAYGLACGDFDCDGKSDVIVGSTGQNHILVFFGDGTGQFSAPASAATVAEPRAVEVGDVNGDGMADLIFFDQYGDVYVVAGSGARTLSGSPQRVTGPRATAGLQIADVNRDGKPDLLLVDQYKTVMTLVNTTP